MADVLVELLARDAGLNGTVKVGLVNGQDFVHLRQVHAYAAVDGEHVTLKGCADAERDDRGAVHAAKVGDVAHFLGGARERDGIGGSIGVVRFILAVVFTYATRGGNSLSKQRTQRP